MKILLNEKIPPDAGTEVYITPEEITFARDGYYSLVIAFSLFYLNIKLWPYKKFEEIACNHLH